MTPPTFEPVVTPAAPAAPRVTACTWFGVRVPRSVPLFDGRVLASDNPTAPWGERYYSRGGYALGLVGGWGDGRARHLCSLQDYCDARQPSNAERTAGTLRDARRILARSWREWRAAGRWPAKRGEGGSCHYRPAAIELDNFGATILGDGGQERLRSFKCDGRRGGPRC